MSFFSIAKGFHKLSSHPPPELTHKELDRLRAITIYNKTRDVSLVCKAYGISRATLYRWLKRYDPKNLNSLLGINLVDPGGFASPCGRMILSRK